jgi:hypothetical protein
MSGIRQIESRVGIRVAVGIFKLQTAHKIKTAEPVRPDPDASLSKLIFDREPPSQPASDEKLKRSGQPNMIESDGYECSRDEVRGSQEQIQNNAMASL